MAESPVGVGIGLPDRRPLVAKGLWPFHKIVVRPMHAQCSCGTAILAGAKRADPH